MAKKKSPPEKQTFYGWAFKSELTEGACPDFCLDTSEVMAKKSAEEFLEQGSIEDGDSFVIVKITVEDEGRQNDRPILWEPVV